MPLDPELDVRRRQIRFRCGHRGMREMDILLGTFAAAALADLSPAELDDFELLLEVPDREALGWLTGEIETPVSFDTQLLRRLKAFHRHDRPLPL